MRLSTKGRYGLRIILDMALQEGEEWFSVNDISKRQNISLCCSYSVGTSLPEVLPPCGCPSVD
ncbi:MAG: hypothetical protein ABH886_11530 [Candidatus Desantisbacteria bacterium]